MRTEMGQEEPKKERRPGSLNHPHEEGLLERLGCLDFVAVPAVAVLVLSLLAGCPAAECKAGEQTAPKTWYGPVKAGKRKLCQKVEVCEKGKWTEVINPDTCHVVDA